MHSNILKLKTVCKACQKFEDDMTGNLFFSDRQHNNRGPSAEGVRHSLQNTEFSCDGNPTKMPQEWSSGLPRIPSGSSKP